MAASKVYSIEPQLQGTIDEMLGAREVIGRAIGSLIATGEITTFFHAPRVPPKNVFALFVECTPEDLAVIKKFPGIAPPVEVPANMRTQKSPSLQAYFTRPGNPFRARPSRGPRMG